jgi:hypothetical protein
MIGQFSIIGLMLIRMAILAPAIDEIVLQQDRMSERPPIEVGSLTKGQDIPLIS